MNAQGPLRWDTVDGHCMQNGIFLPPIYESGNTFLSLRGIGGDMELANVVKFQNLYFVFQKETRFQGLQVLVRVTIY